MQSTLTLRTRVLPGHRVEVVAPDLPEGDMVEVAISPIELPDRQETAKEWSARLREWAGSHEDRPRLAPEAFHRAHYYAEDE